MRGLRIGVALAQEHFGFRFPGRHGAFRGRRRGRDGPQRPPALPAAQVVASGPFGSAWRGPRPSALSSMGPGCDAFVYDQDSRSGGAGGGLRLLPRCVGLGGFGGRRLAGGRRGAGVSRPRVAPSFSAVRPDMLQRPGCRTPPDASIQQRCMRLAGGRPRPAGSGAAWFDRIKGAVLLGRCYPFPTGCGSARRASFCLRGQPRERLGGGSKNPPCENSDFDLTRILERVICCSLRRRPGYSPPAACALGKTYWAWKECRDGAYVG